MIFGWIMESELCDDCGAVLGYFGECPDCAYDPSGSEDDDEFSDSGGNDDVIVVLDPLLIWTFDV